MTGKDCKGSKEISSRANQLSIKARKMEVPLKRLSVQENLPSGVAIPGDTRKG